MSIINGFRESPSIHYISLLDNKFLSCFARTIISQIVCYNVSSTIGCELLIDTKKRDLQSLPKKLKESIPSPKNRFTHKKTFHYIPLQKTMQRVSKAMRRGNEKPRSRQPFLRVMQSRFFVTQFFCE